MLELRGPEAADPDAHWRASRREEEGEGATLVCATCGARITSRAHRVEIAGAHEHTRTNPYGIRYSIGCFGEAGGLVAVSEPTTALTWFPPHAWEIEVCATCGTHLGWRFSTTGSCFHGLILDRLTEAEEGH